MSFRLTINLRELAGGDPDRLARTLERAADLRPLLRGMGQATVSEAKRHFDEGGPAGRPWPASRRGGQTLVDSGQLRRSLTYAVTGADSVSVGSNVRYAAIHQFGGTIRAKAGRMLAIPLPGITGRPRDFADTFIRAKEGEGGKRLAIIYQQRARSVRALFVLVASATIPARPYVVVTERLERTFDALAGKHFFGAGAGGGDS